MQWVRGLGQVTHLEAQQDALGPGRPVQDGVAQHCGSDPVTGPVCAAAGARLRAVGRRARCSGLAPSPSASVDVEGPASSPYCLASAARGRPQSGAAAAAPGALGSMPALLPRGAVQRSPSKEVQAGSAAGLLKIKDSSKRVQMPGARPTQVRRAKSLCTRLQPGTAPHIHCPLCNCERDMCTPQPCQSPGWGHRRFHSRVGRPRYSS